MYDIEMTVIDEQIDTYEAELVDAAGVLNLANARLVEVVDRAIRDESWIGTGVQSPAQWLAYRAGVSLERAKVLVRVAERRASYPQVIAAFDSAELSLEQVAELVKAPVGEFWSSEPADQVHPDPSTGAARSRTTHWRLID